MSRPDATVALCYHRIGRPAHDPFGLAVTPEHFAEQLEVIARQRPLALADLAGEIIAGAVLPGGVAVTFDDGYRDNLVSGKPALERAGVPATVFITTGLTGTRGCFWWEELDDLVLERAPASPAVTLRAGADERTFRFDGPGGRGGGGLAVWAWLRERPAAEIEAVLGQLRAWRGRPEPLEAGDELRVMDREELRTLRAGGLIEVGAHTRTHPVLAAQPLTVQRAEIEGSRRDLEAWLDEPVHGFAYPFGKRGPEYARATAQLVRDAGFHWACAIHPRPVTRRSPVYEIPRHVPPDVGGDAFEAWLRERLQPPGPVRRSAAELRSRLDRRLGRPVPSNADTADVGTAEPEMRADWRFLLPGGRAERAVSFASGGLAASLPLVAATVVDGSDAAACDLAAASSPGAAQVRAALAALAPGGSLYAEWTRPKLGGEPAVRRLLRDGGFEDVRCFFAWPPPRRGSPGFWLPLGSPGAVSHMLATRSRPAGPHGALLAAARAGAWRLARALGLLPLSVIARRSGPRAGEGEPSLGEAVAEALGIGGRGCDLMLLTGGESVLNKVVALPFVAGEPAPRAAVKIARVSRSRQTLDNERKVLERLAPAAIPGVPRVLFAGRWGDGPLVVESVVEGRPLWQHLAAGGDVAPVLERGTDLLIAVAAATAETGRPALGGWRERIAREASIAAEGDPANAAALHAALPLLEALDGICATLLHGDCTPWNLVVEATGAVGLLDWESSIVDGLPLFDLTYLLGMSAIYVDGVADTPAEPESYRRLLDPSTPLGALRGRLERRYALATGLSGEALRPLRIATWIFQHRLDLVAVELETT